MAKIDVVEVIPSARRLVTSLRDVGYDLVHAVADLVDNSIAARAQNVAVDVRFEGPNSWVRVVDDGEGMGGDEITEAMRYGADRDYEPDDLGRFGLGLKTASLSQARRLWVASRRARKYRRIEIRCLDLDHVVAVDRWEILRAAADEVPAHLVDPLKDGPGTVVLWEALDRVLGYKVPWGDRARASLLNLTEQLELHLGMVFHRFISGEVSGREALRVTINGTTVEPWDPFCRSESATRTLGPQEHEVSISDGTGVVRVEPFLLPTRHQFSDESAFNRAAGPARWNSQQGLYVYRANRLIQSGGWNRMRAADEHTKYARVAVDFFPDLDAAFEINVAKARVSLPAVLRERLRPQVDQLIKVAQVAYRSSPERAPRGKTPPVHGRQPIQRKEASAAAAPTRQPQEASRQASPRGQRVTAAAQRHRPIDVRPARRALEEAARRAGQEQALAAIAAQLLEDKPEVAHELGW